MHLFYNRSGISHKCDLWRINNRSFKRTQYTTIEKMKIFWVIEKMVEEEQVTYAQASSALSFNQGMISRWRKEQGQFAAQASSRPAALSLHAGPNSILKNVEEQLIAYVDEWHGKGLPVNRFTLMRKACSLIPELSQKSEHAALMSISRFMKKNRLTHRMATHKAQHPPSEVEAEALQFLHVIRPVLTEQNWDLDYVINMDQTPVYHSMDFKMSIVRVGAHTINLRTLASDAKHVTVAVPVMASGQRIKSMVVFKGE
jgi:hypothetical protein